jgi:hypothetical protein
MHEGAFEILTRMPHSNTYQYLKKPGVDVSVEHAIEKYKLAGSIHHRRIVDKKLQNKHQRHFKKAQGDKTPKTSFFDKPKATKGIDELTKILHKALGVEVKVSGRIDIVFRFER